MTVVARQAVELDMEFTKGSTFRHQMVWQSGPAGEETEVNLLGCTARMQIREDIESPVLHEMTTENGGITLGGIEGTIDFYISDEDTAGFTWNGGVYALEIEFADGDVRDLLIGGITAYDEVTR